MPQKPKRRIGRIQKRHSSTVVGSGAPYAPAAEQPAEHNANGANDVESVPCAESRMTLYARLAWLGDYSLIFKAEAAINGAAAAIFSHMSSWRKRLLGKGGAVAAREQERSEARISQDYERLARERSVRHIPFSQAAKAISWLVDQVPTVEWNVERARRALPGQKWTTQLLEKMLELRPPPEFTVHKLIRCFVFDQTYAVTGRGSGAGSKYTNPVQKVDGTGNKIKKERRVYINSFDLAVDARECQLSSAAIDLIAQRGPYTQDFARVLPILHPDASEAFMNEMMGNTATLLGNIPRNNLNAATIMHTLLGRPNVNVGGPDYITDLPPMMDRDTNKYVDMVFILRTALEFYGFVPLILRAVGDGQSVLMLSYLKRFFPRLYKHVLIGNGHWHSQGHFMLQGFSLFYRALYKRTSQHLHCNPTILDPERKNLEKNAFLHYQNHLFGVHVATIVYFITVVEDPPPDLFLKDPVRAK